MLKIAYSGLLNVLVIWLAILVSHRLAQNAYTSWWPGLNIYPFQFHVRYLQDVGLFL